MYEKISSVIKELQIKVTVRHNYTLLEWLILKKFDNAKC